MKNGDKKRLAREPEIAKAIEDVFLRRPEYFFIEPYGWQETLPESERD